MWPAWPDAKDADASLAPEEIAAKAFGAFGLDASQRDVGGRAACASVVQTEVAHVRIVNVLWELPARAAMVYGALLVLMRVSGKRTVGQFTPFDLLVVMLLSESVSSGLNGSEDSVTGGLLAAATLIGLNVLVAVVTARSTRLQMLAEGSPVLVGRDGRLFAATLRRCHVPMLDVERALREADCDLKDMKFAFLEADGGISVLKNSSGDVKQGDGAG